MSPIRYATLVLGRTFRRSVNITDRASILIGPFVTAYFWLRGGPMPSGIDGLVAVGVLMTAGGALLMRLLAAPYLIWKDDQATARELLERLDDPIRYQSLEMNRYSTELRKKLSRRLAEFLEYAQLSTDEELFNKIVAPRIGKSIRKQRLIHNLLWQLGHDVILRVACWNLMSYCGETISLAAKGDFRPERAQRIKVQSRYTMKLIHHPTGEEHAIALAQIEVILSKDGESIFTFEENGLQSPKGTEAETQP